MVVKPWIAMTRGISSLHVGTPARRQCCSSRSLSAWAISEPDCLRGLRGDGITGRDRGASAWPFPSYIHFIKMQLCEAVFIWGHCPLISCIVLCSTSQSKHTFSAFGYCAAFPSPQYQADKMIEPPSVICCNRNKAIATKCCQRIMSPPLKINTEHLFSINSNSINSELV